MDGANGTAGKNGTQLDEIFNRHEATIRELQAEAKSSMSSEEFLQKIEDLQLLGREFKQEVSKVNQSYNRLEQLIESVQTPILFLDKKLKIQQYTQGVTRIFSQATFNRGELLSDVLNYPTFNELNKHIQKFFKSPVLQETEFYLQKAEEWYLTHIFPSSITDSNGIAITFLNITTDKEYEKKLNKLNQTLELEIQKQNQQINKLGSELIVAEQKERKRIARLLHNDLQQQLFSIQTKIKLLNDDVPTEIAAEMGEIIDQIEDSLQLTHQLVVSLEPPNIENNNLYEGINWLCKYMYNFHDLLVEIKHVSHIKLQNKDVLILLLEIIRELLFNVVKHTSVKKAKITTQQQEDVIHIHVIDEGKGFNEDNVDSLTNFGLSETREHLALIGGRLLIDSAPGKGTDICLSIPRSTISKEQAKLSYQS